MCSNTAGYVSCTKNLLPLSIEITMTTEDKKGSHVDRSELHDLGRVATGAKECLVVSIGERGIFGYLAPFPLPFYFFSQLNWTIGEFSWCLTCLQWTNHGKLTGSLPHADLGSSGSPLATLPSSQSPGVYK